MQVFLLFTGFFCLCVFVFCLCWGIKLTPYAYFHTAANVTIAILHRNNVPGLFIWSHRQCHVGTAASQGLLDWRQNKCYWKKQHDSLQGIIQMDFWKRSPCQVTKGNKEFHNDVYLLGRAHSNHCYNSPVLQPQRNQFHCGHEAVYLTDWDSGLCNEKASL